MVASFRELAGYNENFQQILKLVNKVLPKWHKHAHKIQQEGATTKVSHYEQYALAIRYTVFVTLV